MEDSIKELKQQIHDDRDKIQSLLFRTKLLTLLLKQTQDLLVSDYPPNHPLLLLIQEALKSERIP